ncbi:hypothetical protein ASB57_04200 [Bordetella sp. N]|nr:hypothetical protein ASB57_04200 [Bordetella sp. N]
MRDHILATAGTLFYQEGIRAVGVDRIIAEAGVAKPTLYKHFRTKEALILTYLEGRHEAVIGALTAAMQAAEAEPLPRVLAIFEWLETKVEVESGRGCAFLLALAEHEESGPIKDIVKGHKDALRALFTSALGLRGRRAADLPLQLAQLYDGALSTIMVRRNKEGATLARKTARILVSAWLEPAAAR